MKTLMTLLLSIAATSAIAASHTTGTDFTPEQRKQMAEMHTKAAACLNSNKSIQECRDEMMKNCPMVKDGHCPMMSMGRGMGPDTTPTPPKSKINK